MTTLKPSNGPLLTFTAEELEQIAARTSLEEIRAELRKRQTKRDAVRLRAEFAAPGGLIKFIRYFWPILEPFAKFQDGWALEGWCLHLEGVTHGQIIRLLGNICPGFMKSLSTNVFWPAWEWGPMNMPYLRYLSFSYSAELTERDNGKMRDLILSPEYQMLYGDVFGLTKTGQVLVANDCTGTKRATSVGGVSTGERGDRVLLDDPHNIKEGESELKRNSTTTWFRESMSNRLNNVTTSAIVVIMQRVHESDVSGIILDPKYDMDYVHYMVPMEFESGRRCTTVTGFRDPRTKDGELAWPERFPPTEVGRLKKVLGPFAWASQYQQSPVPRGGGIILSEYWQPWTERKFPVFEYIVGSLDTAYTEKQENDPSAFTLWGFWRDKDKRPRVMLMWAWRKWLRMHGDRRRLERLPGEVEAAWVKRTQPDWGLCEWTIWSCRRYKANQLLIEAKAAGITAAQEIKAELYATESWGVRLIDPKNLDKVARTHAVQPVWANHLIYSPVDANGADLPWADMVIQEMAAFPKGQYDDLHDTATQAISHLRTIGLLAFDEEIEVEREERLKHRPTARPLYDV